jgi:hypothetical protein
MRAIFHDLEQSNRRPAPAARAGILPARHLGSPLPGPLSVRRTDQGTRACLLQAR